MGVQFLVDDIKIEVCFAVIYNVIAEPMSRFSGSKFFGF